MKKVFILIGIFTMCVLNCFVLSAYAQKRDIYTLNETSWELAKIQQKDKILSIPKGTNITINFSKDGINGHSAVNKYFGNYKISNDNISISGIGATEMAGSQELMNIERKFFDILQSSPKISYDKETLTLSNNKGEIWTFKVLTLEKKLHNTDWRLINMAGKNMKLQMKNEEQITLSFTENEINGNAGINNYFGSYKISNDNISIQGIGATEMAGPDNLMRIEGEYLDLLEHVKKIKLINQKTLVLTTDKGKTLTFEK
ncbi:META domain-containing protein [Leptotrichia alba]|uniref:META domain-containing protein n=1 Tax=Leptotrichia alba TaxID=3239304 RepID=A0AB39V3U3_9FUSO